jgi:hypothetical protein
MKSIENCWFCKSRPSIPDSMFVRSLYKGVKGAGVDEKEFQIPRCLECAQSHQEIEAYKKKLDEKASCLSVIGLILGYEKLLLYRKAAQLGTNPPIYFTEFPTVKSLIRIGWTEKRGKAKLDARDSVKIDRESQSHGLEDLQIHLARLQINQVPINPGKCPICNQVLSSGEIAKTIDIYSYLLTTSGYGSHNTRYTWSKYREFEAHPFEICRQCKERENIGIRLRKWLGWSAIILLCITLFFGMTYDIYLYPLLYIMMIALIIRGLVFIKYGPIPIEKKLTKIALSVRKQKHLDAGVFNENQMIELIKRKNLTNP